MNKTVRAIIEEIASATDYYDLEITVYEGKKKHSINDTDARNFMVDPDILTAIATKYTYDIDPAAMTAVVSIYI